MSTLLEDHVRERTRLGGLEGLAYASGVEHGTLVRIARSEVSPSSAHRRAILGALPDLDPAVLDSHAPPTPTFVTTRRGVLPDGTSLVVAPASEVRVGDLVSYVPPRRLPGSHWSPVLTEPRRAAYLVVLDLGGVESYLRPELPVRLARTLS